MGSGQGWFESDADYRNRTETEANERTIKESTGSVPGQGWFESNEQYSSRIASEAHEHTIERNTGNAARQGLFESEENYRSRIEQEANESTVAGATGSSPSQGWFESAEDYNTRVRREANESAIKAQTGEPARQGWFEGDHEYRRRINHEANIGRDLGSPASSRASSFRGSDGGYDTAGGTTLGGFAGSRRFILIGGIAIALFVFWVSHQRSQAQFAKTERDYLEQLSLAQEAANRRQYDQAEAHYSQAYRLAGALGGNHRQDVRSRRDASYSAISIDAGNRGYYAVHGTVFTRLENPLTCLRDRRSCGYHFTPNDHGSIVGLHPGVTVYAPSGKVLRLPNGFRISDLYPVGSDVCCGSTLENAIPRLVFANAGTKSIRIYIARR
jgi:hypothetical protein